MYRDNGTIVSTAGKRFCKILNDRMGTMMEKEEKTSEGQAGIRPNRSCVDHVYTLGKIIQGRKDAGLTTYCLFLDVQKAYDSMEKWVAEKAVCGKLGSEEIRGERIIFFYGMCEKYFDA